MATTFQRARSDEQRAIRRQTILDTAAAMLAEMPVAELSLNELSRRVGLASPTSALLRLAGGGAARAARLAAREWLEHLAEELPSAVSRRPASSAAPKSWPPRSPVACRAPGAVRPDQLAGSGLEHNVSLDAVTELQARLARRAAALGGIVGCAARVRRRGLLAHSSGVWLTSSALWAYARPPEAVVQACAADERLQRARLDFRGTLADHLTTLAIGLQARAAG